MPRWYDNATEHLEKDLDEGSIALKEFWEQMADLNAELRESAHERAEQAYRDEMGDW